MSKIILTFIIIPWIQEPTKKKYCDLETSRVVDCIASRVHDGMSQNECTTDTSSMSDDENRDDTDVSAPRRDVLRYYSRLVIDYCFRSLE